MTAPRSAATRHQALLAELASVDDNLARVRATWLSRPTQAADEFAHQVAQRDTLRRELRAVDLMPAPARTSATTSGTADLAIPEVGVLLPLRIETRFKDGELHLRVIPDEPWFARDDPRISDGELAALRRYVTSANEAADPDVVQVAWRELAGHVGAARAVFLHRRFVTTAPEGPAVVRDPAPDERRTEPVLPRIVGFPEQLVVWLATGSRPRPVLKLPVDRSRLLADFADPDIPGDRRWWEDWDEAVEVGVAGVIPAEELADPIDALYVTGLGEDSPAELFGGLASEGRLGLVEPGTPTNSVEGAPAAPLADDAETWWKVLTSLPGDLDTDVSRALTGDPLLLGRHARRRWSPPHARLRARHRALAGAMGLRRRTRLGRRARQ